MNSDSINCTKCGELVEVIELENHIKEELSYYPYRCAVCQMRFLSEHQLRNTHFPRKHPGRPVQIFANEKESLEEEVAKILRESMKNLPTFSNPISIRNSYSINPALLSQAITPSPHQSMKTPESWSQLQYSTQNSTQHLGDARLDSHRVNSALLKEFTESEAEFKPSVQKTGTVSITPASFESERRSLHNHLQAVQLMEAVEGREEEDESRSGRNLNASASEDSFHEQERAEVVVAPKTKKKRKRATIIRGVPPPYKNPDISERSRVYYAYLRRVRAIVRKRILIAEAPEKCALCPYEYRPSMSDLHAQIAKHVLNHLGLKAFLCELCCYSTNTIDRHLRERHPKIRHTMRGYINIRDEVVERAIDNIFVCFPDLAWIRNLSAAELAQNEFPIRRNPGPRTQLRKVYIKGLEKLKIPYSVTEENVAFKFKQRVITSRLYWKQQCKLKQEPLTCKIEGCRQVIKQIISNKVEQHVISHFHLPLYRCSDCEDEVKFIYHHALQHHPNNREEVHLNSENYKGKYEEQLIELVEQCFPVPKDFQHE